MRRTHLVAAAFAGATCLTGLAIPAAHAAPGSYSEPTAEVHPSRAAPGQHVTVSVTCGPIKMKAPKSITADSKAFEGGSAHLYLVPEKHDYAAGPEYSGKAKIVWSKHWEKKHDGYAKDHESYDSYGKEHDSYGKDSYGKDSWEKDSYEKEDSYGKDSYGKEHEPYGGSEDPYGKEHDSYGYGHHATKYPVTGYCPDGKMFKTYVEVTKKPGGGSHAGIGGTSADMNTATLAGGSALLATALGCGAYLMRRKQRES